MKKLYTIVLLTVLAFSAKAQDTIIFRNGDEQRVKVTEVSDSQIKYRLWSNQDGPVYTKNVSDIFMVKYEGGYKEIYGQSRPAQQPQATESRQQYNQHYSQPTENYSYGNGVMEVSRGELEINGRTLTDIDVKSLMGLSGYDTYTSAQAQRRGGKAWITLGWINLLGGLFLVILDSDYALDGYGVTSGSILVGISQIELPIGYVLKGIGNGRLNWLADNYNKNGHMSQNLSLTAGPSILSAPTATGNAYGLGAGIQLHF